MRVKPNEGVFDVYSLYSINRTEIFISLFMRNTHITKIIVILLCLMFVRGLIYALVIPFERSPDENFYFRLIKAKQLQMEQATEEERLRVAAEFEVVKHVLLYPESKKKPSRENFYGVNLLAPPPSSELYFLAGAWLLRFLALDNLRDEIYVIRGLSILCGTLIVLIAAFVSRELFPDSLFLQIGVPFFICFVPQFSAMCGVINNDKPAEMFAALLFLSVVKILKNGVSLWNFSAYTLCMGLALLSKRTTIFAFPLLLLLFFVYYWKRPLGIRMHLMLFAMLAGIGIAGNILAGVLHEVEGWWNNYLLWMPPHRLKALLSGTFFSLKSLKYIVKFLTVMYWSFWGIFGYMNIHLHHFWYVSAACVQGLSLMGLAKNLIEIQLNKAREWERWQVKSLYVFGVSIVFVFSIIFYRSIIARVGGEPLLAQGRRFFPVIIPISVLTVLGLERLFPKKYHQFFGGAGMAGLFILDTICISNYLLLNFHFRALF